MLVAMVLVFVALVIVIYVSFHVPVPKYISQSFSPNGIYELNVYTVWSDEKEGNSVYIDVHNDKEKQFRTRIYQQWYCMNVDIEWVNDEIIRINQHEMNVVTDTMIIATKIDQFCPS